MRSPESFTSMARFALRRSSTSNSSRRSLGPPSGELPLGARCVTSPFLRTIKVVRYNTGFSSGGSMHTRRSLRYMIQLILALCQPNQKNLEQWMDLWLRASEGCLTSASRYSPSSPPFSSSAPFSSFPGRFSARLGGGWETSTSSPNCPSSARCRMQKHLSSGSKFFSLLLRCTSF